MPVLQSFNNKTKRWVKFKTMKKGMSKILDVKQRMPLVPFKGIKKMKRRT